MNAKKNFLTGLISGLVIGILIFGVWYHQRSHRMDVLHTQSEKQQQLIRLQDALIDSLERRSYSGLLDQLMHRLDTEFQQRPNPILSEETLTFMTTLSYTFKPYHLREADSLTSGKLSPERGKMLLLITGMHLDSAVMQKIFNRVSFAGADVRDAQMQGSDLRGADLEGANFYGAHLQGARLDNANLKGANFWGANLSHASCKGTIAKSADLRWADLQQTNWHGADLTEANLASSQLGRADFCHAVMQWADLTGAFLQSARLDSTDMFRATLKKSNLEKTDLQQANLTLANMSDAMLMETNLTGANLSQVIVSSEGWITSLVDWKVTGVAEIESSYSVVPANTTGELFYQVKKK